MHQRRQHPLPTGYRNHLVCGHVDASPRGGDRARVLTGKEGRDQEATDFLIRHAAAAIHVLGGEEDILRGLSRLLITCDGQPNEGHLSHLPRPSTALKFQIPGTNQLLSTPGTLHQ